MYVYISVYIYKLLSLDIYYTHIYQYMYVCVYINVCVYISITHTESYILIMDR